MDNWQPGDSAVCVDASPNTYGETPPFKVGSIHIITAAAILAFVTDL